MFRFLMHVFQDPLLCSSTVFFSVNFFGLSLQTRHLLIIFESKDILYCQVDISTLTKAKVTLMKVKKIT
jgi:hypothetical protein